MCTAGVCFSVDAGDLNPGVPACTENLHQPNHIDLNQNQPTCKQPFNSSNVVKKTLWNNGFFLRAEKKEKNSLYN